MMSHQQDQILNFLKSNPDKTEKEIADGICANVYTLHHAIMGLKRFGLVRAKHVGYKVLWEVV